MWQASEITTPGGSIVKESIAIILVLLLKDGWIGNWKIKRLLYLLWLLILRPNISKIIIFQRIFRMSALSSFSDIHSKWIVASGVPDLSNPVYVVLTTALPFVSHTDGRHSTLHFPSLVRDALNRISISRDPVGALDLWQSSSEANETGKNISSWWAQSFQRI